MGIPAAPRASRCRPSAPSSRCQMRTEEDTAAPAWRRCRPARPRRRADRGRRDRRRAAERRRLPGRAVRAADAELRPVARAHRRTARRSARPCGSLRIIPGGSGSVPCIVASLLNNLTRQGDIAAWLWHPEGATGAVVLGHGLSAVHDQRLPAYAERFADAGLAALLFDYRHFGSSGGEPRRCSTSSASSRTGGPRSTTRAGCPGSSGRPVRLLVRRRPRDRRSPPRGARWRRSSPSAR